MEITRDGAARAPLARRDLGIAVPFEPQCCHFAKSARQRRERACNTFPPIARFSCFVRRRSGVRETGIDGRRLTQRAPHVQTPNVETTVRCNHVEPCADTRIATEFSATLHHDDEYVLNDFVGEMGIIQQMQCARMQRRRMPAHELFQRAFITGYGRRQKNCV